MASSSMDPKPKKTSITDIPHHILFDAVLPKLPAKSLLRFKSVARKWRSVISSVKFAKTHVQYHSSKISSKHVLTHIYKSSEDMTLFEALDYGDMNALVYERFNHAYDNSYDCLIASCNGLALLYYLPNDTKVFTYVVHNPLLGHFNLVDIPHPTHFRLGRTDDSVDDFNLGFGYVSSRNDYYVVVCSTPRDSEIEVHLFSLESKHWMTYTGTLMMKEKALSLLFSGCYFESAGTLIKETLHWGMSQDKDNQCIFAFDLADPESDKTMLFECPPFRLGESEGIVYEGRFCLCCLDGCLCAWANYEGNVVEMWMMKDYGKSWTKLLRFDTESFRCLGFFGPANTGQVLVYTSKDELIPADFTRSPPLFSDAVLKEKWSVVDYVPSLVSVRDITDPVPLLID